jgi:L-threonylcarbamoyladenylate synthase
MPTGEPRVLRVRPGDGEAAFRQALAALQEGKLVVLPTDTVYGIACRADSETAVTALYAAKGRAAEKALPVLIADAGQLPQVCDVRVPAAVVLAERFWPGPLTLVLRKSRAIPDLVTGGKPTVGVRVPDCAITRRLLAAGGFVVAVTSANLSGEAPALRVDDLSPLLLSRVGLVLDAGPCPGGVASTVLDMTSDPPRVLRPGPVTQEELQAALGRLVVSG